MPKPTSLKLKLLIPSFKPLKLNLLNTNTPISNLLNPKFMPSNPIFKVFKIPTDSQTLIPILYNYLQSNLYQNPRAAVCLGQMRTVSEADTIGNNINSCVATVIPIS